MSKYEEENNTEEKTYLNIKVSTADGGETFFRLKKTTKMRSLINAFCKNKGLQEGSVRFSFDGQRLDGSSTVEDVGLEDNDIIDAMVEQTGGGGCGKSIIRRLCTTLCCWCFCEFQIIIAIFVLIFAIMAWMYPLKTAHIFFGFFHILWISIITNMAHLLQKTSLGRFIALNFFYPLDYALCFLKLSGNGTVC